MIPNLATGGPARREAIKQPSGEISSGWGRQLHLADQSCATTLALVSTPDLIHQRTRREFCEFCVGWGVLRTIRSAFQVEGFDPGEPVDSGGERRSLFDTYERNIDWADPEQVGRAIAVFEEMLSWAWGHEHAESATRGVVRTLSRDGYEVDDKGRISSSSSTALVALPLEQLRDPASIEEHLRRLEKTGDGDPPLAISSAKALIEATCKIVLDELDETYNEKLDVPALAREVQKALKIHPDTIAPTKKGRDTIVRTLSNLSQVAVGMAELRNEYGPDHGRSRPTTGLTPRHAHLAVGAAATYCRFLLETLADRKVG